MTGQHDWMSCDQERDALREEVTALRTALRGLIDAYEPWGDSVALQVARRALAVGSEETR